MKILSRLFFFLCLPGIIWHVPLCCEPITKTIDLVEDYFNFSPWDLLKSETLSFDRIMDFVEMIEDTDNLEEIFTENQLEEIQDFIIFLMRNGIRDWDTEAKGKLEEDIAWMKGEPNNSTLAYEYDDDDDEEDLDYWMSTFNGYQGIKILPAVLMPSKKPEMVLCKSNLKKFYKNIKRAAKRHKKEIIIATVVVVAATVVIIATSGAAAPVIAGGAVAAVGASEGSKSSSSVYEDSPRNPVNKPGEVQFQEDRNPPQPSAETSYTNNYTQNIQTKESYTPQLEAIPKSLIPIKEAIIKQTSEIKEELSELVPGETLNIVENEKHSFWNEAKNKARETGSHITHEVYEAVTDQLEIIPQIAGAFSKKLPDPLQKNDPFDKDPRESYQERVESGHEKIDEIFGTDQSNIYAAEGKTAREELTTGMLPPPGGFNSIGKNGKPLSKAYVTAKNGGKHAKTLKDYSVKPNREIEKGIRSFEKQISKHKDKIANPKKYYPEWDNFHPNRKKSLVNKGWPKEITGFEEERDILKTILDLRE